MINKLFKGYYEQAKVCRIETSDLFNCDGIFWISLTNRQQHKMCELLAAQKCPISIVSGCEWYQLQGGLRVKKM